MATEIESEHGAIRQGGASHHANLGMVRAGIEALQETRANGSASKENGDANIVYAVYEAMLKKREEQKLGS